MLVVRRRAGESIQIGDDIEVHITEVTPSRVTVGIVAPREVAVVRSEVRLTREQNKAASSAVTLESLSKVAGTIRLR